ncbi:hypothetical protein GCM10027578_28730 [Spirosoma luteolum]
MRNEYRDAFDGLIRNQFSFVRPDGLFQKPDPIIAGCAAQQMLGALVDEVPPKVGKTKQVGGGTGLGPGSVMLVG